MAEEKSGYESTELKIKAKELRTLFVKLFGHIDFADVLFFRIEREGGSPLVILPVDQDPWKYIVPYKYVLIAYQEYDHLSPDLQMQALAHKLLCIPKHYQVMNALKAPDIVLHEEEHVIMDWMRDHKFNIT